MLVTSLGDIIVAIDGKNMDVTWREMGADEKLCPDISGRYCLKVFFEPDGKRHTISCSTIRCLTRRTEARCCFRI